jgi:spore coat polysaccharide biosynthesis protein SpsF
MNTVALVQARMGSTRLPGKVLLDLAGRPALAWTIERLLRSRKLSSLIIATSSQPADNAIEDFCRRMNVRCYRGSEDDVLDRFYQAARQSRAEVVVRLTADNLLIDPLVVDSVIEAFEARQPEVAYVSNVHPTRTYPRGQDTEVMTFAALERAWHEDQDPRLREHVTPYIIRRPELFPAYCVTHSPDYSYMRWTLDTGEDFEFLRRVCEAIPGIATPWPDIANVILQHPDWLALNRDIVQKKV